jgi:hypothetical protein
MSEKKGSSTDYPREKPKNPKGSSVEPPCLATGRRKPNENLGSRTFLKKFQKSQKYYQRTAAAAQVKPAPKTTKTILSPR